MSERKIDPSELRVGDRVRHVIEGEVRRLDDRFAWIGPWAASLRPSGCKHKRKPHTVAYMPADPDPYDIPCPYWVDFDNHRDMAKWLAVWLRDGANLAWVKGYRSDNSAYECFRWDPS